MGIGSILFSAPHFLGGHHLVNSNMNSSDDNICRVPTPQTSSDILDALLPGVENRIKPIITQGIFSSRICFSAAFVLLRLSTSVDRSIANRTLSRKAAMQFFSFKEEFRAGFTACGKI